MPVSAISMYYKIMIKPRPEERIHVDNGPIVQAVRVNDADVFCLCRKKTRSLLWTGDVDSARKAGLPSNNKGDFLGWVENQHIEFLPTTP